MLRHSLAVFDIISAFIRRLFRRRADRFQLSELIRHILLR
jgi:hypothetical protein